MSRNFDARSCQSCFMRESCFMCLLRASLGRIVHSCIPPHTWRHIVISLMEDCYISRLLKNSRFARHYSAVNIRTVRVRKKKMKKNRSALAWHNITGSDIKRDSPTFWYRKHILREAVLCTQWRNVAARGVATSRLRSNFDGAGSFIYSATWHKAMIPSALNPPALRFHLNRFPCGIIRWFLQIRLYLPDESTANASQAPRASSPVYDAAHDSASLC